MRALHLTLTDAQWVYVSRLAHGAHCDEGEAVRAILRIHMAKSRPVLSTVKAAERQLLVRSLRETHGNITHAAMNLGIHRRTLQLQIKKFAITHDEY